jgi:hypothetical protein
MFVRVTYAGRPACTLYCKYTDECAHMHTCVHLCVMHFRMILLSVRNAVEGVSQEEEKFKGRNKLSWTKGNLKRKKCSTVPVKVVQNEKECLVGY